MSIYELTGRAAHGVAAPALNLIGLHTKPRVRALVISTAGTVLLVRSWFGYQKWSLPGGGIKQSESAARAAVRETFEETGILVPTDAFEPAGTFINTDSAVSFMVDCQAATDVEEKPPHVIIYRRLEILDAAWFSAGKLPYNRSPLVDQALARFTKQR